MSSRSPLFPEPTSGSDAPLGYAEPKVYWYRKNNGTAAATARAAINSMYETSPAGSNRAFRNRLRSTDDNTHYSALDELLVGSMLSSEDTVEYEPEATGTDFAVFRNGALYCAIECVTLLSSAQYSRIEGTRAQVVDILNDRLTASTHSITINSVVGSGNLPARQIAREFERLILSLPGQVRSTGIRLMIGSYEVAASVYSLPGTPVQDGGRIAELGLIPDSRTVAEDREVSFTSNDRRLAVSLNGKADRKYTQHDAPYAIFVSLRQDFSDLHDLQNAVYGTNSIDVEQRTWVRANDGLFGRRGDEWKSVKVGAVFAVIDWEPYRTTRPEVFRLNNPAPSLDFPDDVISVTREVRWDPTGRAMVWV